MGNRSKLSRRDKKRDYFVHESAYVDKGAIIAKGTQIWHFSHIMKAAKIGENCKIGQNVYIGPNVVIGNNVKIQNNVSIYTGVTLEDDVFCGPSMVFTNIINPRSAYSRNSPEYYLKTKVKKGATIGANTTIVCGHTIGRHAFIGAGSVVTKDAPAYGLIYGNPAKFKGWMCECGEKLKFAHNKAQCPKCKKAYKKSGNTVQRSKGLKS